MDDKDYDGKQQDTVDEKAVATVIAAPHDLVSAVDESVVKRPQSNDQRLNRSL